jgi:hypothetical protein
MPDLEEFLEHHGVKGQKWGIRRARPARIVSREYKKASQLKNKHISTMTNEELKALNARSNLEQQYHRLHPDTVALGKRYVKGAVATTVGAAALYNLAKGPAGQAAIRTGARIIGKKPIKQLALFK